MGKIERLMRFTWEKDDAGTHFLGKGVHWHKLEGALANSRMFFTQKFHF